MWECVRGKEIEGEGCQRNKQKKKKRIIDSKNETWFRIVCRFKINENLT